MNLPKVTIVVRVGDLRLTLTGLLEQVDDGGGSSSLSTTTSRTAVGMRRTRTLRPVGFRGATER